MLHNKINVLLMYAKLSYRTQKNYNINFIFMILGNILGVFINYFIWHSVLIYSGKSSINSYTSNEVFLYFIINAIIQFVISQDTDFYVAKEIKDGTIVYSLTRPLSYRFINFSKTVGNAMFYLIFICLPLMLIAIIYIIAEEYYNFSIINILLASISFLFSFLIMYLFDFLVGLLSFITMSNWGTSKFKLLLFEILSGNAIPIFMFSLPLRKILKCLPFYYTTCFPTEILLNKVDLISILFGIGTQLIWLFIFFLVTNKCWIKVISGLSINGG